MAKLRCIYGIKIFAENLFKALDKKAGGLLGELGYWVECSDRDDFVVQIMRSGPIPFETVSAFKSGTLTLGEYTKVYDVLSEKEVKFKGFTKYGGKMRVHSQSFVYPSKEYESGFEKKHILFVRIQNMPLSDNLIAVVANNVF